MVEGWGGWKGSLGWTSLSPPSQNTAPFLPEEKKSGQGKELCPREEQLGEVRRK